MDLDGTEHRRESSAEETTRPHSGAVSSVGTADALPGCDHRPVWALAIRRPRLRTETRPPYVRSLKGWVGKRSREDFGRRVADNWDQVLIAENPRSMHLERMESTLVSSAHGLVDSDARVRASSSTDRPPLLKILESTSRDSSRTWAERMAARSQARRLRRVWEADLCLAQADRMSTHTPVRLPLAGGAFTTDDRVWAAEIHDQCSKKYGDEEFRTAAQATLLAQLTARACAEDVLEPHRALRWSWGTTLAARAALNCGKAIWDHSAER